MACREVIVFGGVGCNDFSIGIEIEGTDFEKFNDAQYDTLANLIISIKIFCLVKFYNKPLFHCARKENRSGPIF